MRKPRFLTGHSRGTALEAARTRASQGAIAGLPVKPLQHVPQPRSMLLCGFGENYDVIYIDIAFSAY
jgi:hypothetical protein